MFNCCREFAVPGGLVVSADGLSGLVLLNPSAAFIWSLNRSGSSPGQISARLAEVFEIPLESAQRDVQTCLHNWRGLFGTETGYHWNGVAFSVILDSPELEAEILPRLSHLLAPELSSRAHSFTLRVKQADEPNVAAARALLLQNITQRLYGSDWLAILHAGACGKASAGGGPDSCVIFPASSHSGKTTLAAALLHSGLRFYADDSVCVEANSRLIPAMPFALAVREGSWPLLADLFPGFPDLEIVERFGQRVRFLPPPVRQSRAAARAMVFTSYEPSAEFEVRSMNTFEALLQLKESGFWVDPERVPEFLEWVQSMPVYQVRYSGLDAAVRFLTELAGG